MVVTTWNPWADARDPHLLHGFGDGLDVHRDPSGVQVRGDPRRPVRARRCGVMDREHRLKVRPGLLTGGQLRALLIVLPLVVAGPGDLQQPGHPGHLMVVAPHGHQRESLRLGGLLAKYAAAEV
jgi:hypothetical protein